MANRINRNLRWVMKELEKGGVHDMLEAEVLDAFNQVEVDIMERTGSVKQVDVITFDATPPHDTGTYTLPAGVERIVYIAYPATWSRPMILTNDPKTFDDIKKANVNGTQPLVVLQWNGSLQFWPVGTVGDQVTLYSFSVQTDAQMQVEGTGDPILSRHWDTVLRYGALSILVGGDWEVRYQNQFDQEAHAHIQETGAPLFVDHSAKRLGF